MKNDIDITIWYINSYFLAHDKFNNAYKNVQKSSNYHKLVSTGTNIANIQAPYVGVYKLSFS